MYLCTYLYKSTPYRRYWLSKNWCVRYTENMEKHTLATSQKKKHKAYRLNLLCTCSWKCFSIRLIFSSLSSTTRSVVPINRKKNICCTVWKSQDFCINQILREINFGESLSAKTVVFAIFGAQNFVNLVIFSLQKVQKCIKSKIQSL